jgi:hypothetical protein
MFTKEQIDNWISIGLSGDNASKDNIFANRTDISTLKRDLVDMKVLVDRWDLLSTDFIFPIGMKNLLRENVKKDLDSTIDPNRDRIWGSNVHYVDTIPFNKCMILDLKSLPLSSRHVAVFDVDLRHIERVSNLKVFW